MPVDAPNAPREAPPLRWGLTEGDEIVPGRHALKRLGGGHRYEAYLAWDDHLHAIVVVKVLRPRLVADERALRDLAAEADLLTRLDHPVLLRSFGFVADAPRPHLVLEHLEGPRLSSLVRRYGALPVEQLVPLALQLCAALHYMAAEGFVHLDVKPSNIIMGAPPRLIDLSVARSIDAAARLETPVGTDPYMAPEQCRPMQLGPVGSAADVWGLGATLHRAAMGERAFPDPDPQALEPERRWPQLVEEPAPAVDRVPSAIAACLLECLSFEPGKRPRPAEVAATLEPILDGLPKPRLSRLKPRL
jgi:eukaryotic-like serine/threonine-protein kinase